jgi:hypothetical protein
MVRAYINETHATEARDLSVPDRRVLCEWVNREGDERGSEVSSSGLARRVLGVRAHEAIAQRVSGKICYPDTFVTAIECNL